MNKKKQPPVIKTKIASEKEDYYEFGGDLYEKE